MKNIYFAMFHKTMKKYVNRAPKINDNKDIKNEKNKGGNHERKRFNQCELYNSLFEMQHKGSIAEDGGISDAQICRWIGGKELIPEWILSYNFYNLEECRYNYSGVFEKYVDEFNIFCSMEAEKKLAEEMCQLKMDWGIHLSSVAQEDNLWDILADTLVTALVCEYAMHSVKLDIRLKQYLSEILEHCKEKNVAFKTPFLLSALFQTDFSLLPYTLNKLKSGLGVRWRILIDQYVNAEHSQTFEEIKLDENELLNYAKIRSCLNNKTKLDELEFCCAIVNYPGSSNTLEKLKDILCQYGYDDYGNWRGLLLQNEEELKKSSIDYFARS